MHKVIEFEEKFMIPNFLELEHFILNNLNFSKVEITKEADIYFTDKQNLFLTPKTCLRIRKSPNKNSILTLKKLAGNTYDLRHKIEKNFSFPPQKENRVIHILNRIGFSPYCTVFKERTIFSKTINQLDHNIMIDCINNKYWFLELEITSPIDIEQAKILSLFSDFKNEFNHFNLKKCDENYRDFVKKHF